MRLNPHVPERTARGVAILAEGARRQLLEKARGLSRAVLQRMRPHLDPHSAEKEMRLSGAMAGECSGSDLDHRHMPDPLFFVAR